MMLQNNYLYVVVYETPKGRFIKVYSRYFDGLEAFNELRSHEDTQVCFLSRYDMEYLTNDGSHKSLVENMETFSRGNI